MAILSTKTTQEYEAANIIAKLEVGLDKGTIFNWDNNEWIILKKIKEKLLNGFFLFKSGNILAALDISQITTCCLLKEKSPRPIT